MGSDGKGVLNLDTGENTGSKRLSFKLNLGSGADSTAFKGNLKINQTLKNTNTSIDAVFDGGFEGNISIDLSPHSTKDGRAYPKNSFVFNGKDALKGNFTAKSGINTLDFRARGRYG